MGKIEKKVGGVKRLQKEANWINFIKLLELLFLMLLLESFIAACGSMTCAKWRGRGLFWTNCFMQSIKNKTQNSRTFISNTNDNLYVYIRKGVVELIKKDLQVFSISIDAENFSH